MQNLYRTVKKQFLNDLQAVIGQVHDQSEGLASPDEEILDSQILCRYNTKIMDYCTVTVRGCEDTVIFRLDARIRFDFFGACNLSPENAFQIPFGDFTPDAMLDSFHAGPWWMYPCFAQTTEDLRPRSQNLLIRQQDRHYFFLPLCGDNFRCEINRSGLHLISDTSGLYELHGDFLAISTGSTPYEAIERGFAFARESGAIRVPLRTERQLPDMYRSLGWCSWNAFYHEVSADKLFQKLDEFREKNIPVKWVLIDDGWSVVRNHMLAGFDADPVKFPGGLKACIDRIKNEYGIRYVGVWHAFNGYWDGIDPDSAFCAANREFLTTTPSGMVVPALDEEKAFRFWDAWHSHLAACGVDFVKVDNQSSWTGNILGAMPAAEACRIAHAALERSVRKNFHENIINCMGMDMENVLARPFSALSRNSDDFFPGARRGFMKHLVQNVYNALWHNAVYFCDFDMWWSSHESATQSGVLRAISGSPIYVSDALGGSDPALIRATVDTDGSVMLCDYAARPVASCVYTDCPAENRLLTVWNRSGDAFAMASFNVSEEAVSDSVCFGDIPELLPDTDYVAYEYFTRQYIRITADTRLSLHLEKDDLRVWSIYPVQTENGKETILCGDPTRYVPIASPNKTRVSLDDIL